MSKLCVDKLCVSKLCVDKLCVSKLCADKLCASKLCVNKFCVSKLCGDKLCGSKLCVSKLCVSKLCGDKLCGHKLWAAGRAGRGGSAQPETRTPDKDVGKKISQKFYIYTDVTHTQSHTHTWQVHLKQAAIAASVSRWSAISAHAAF